jgi:hypothetical protein
MKNKLLFITIIILLVNSCCKKPECKCKEEWGYKVSDCTPKHYGPYYLGGVKDYLYFKKGSWWVYKNNLSGETDSIYTVYCDTSVVKTKGTDYKWLSLTYTSIGFKLRSDKYNTDYYYSHSNLYPDVTEFKYGLVFDRAASFTDKTRYSAPFLYPFELGLNFKELIPNLTINNKNYVDIAVFQVWSDESVQLPTLPYNFRPSAPTKYYWAKNVGLVMIEQTLYKVDTQSTIVHKWEIINFNLIK